MANPGNLNRGNTTPPKGNAQVGLDAIADQRAQEAKIRSLTDPDDSMIEVFNELNILVLRLVKKYNRTGGEPTRNLKDTLTEARQYAVVVRDIEQARGATTAAERVFAEMASRISSANLEEVPRPVGEVAVT